MSQTAEYVRALRRDNLNRERRLELQYELGMITITEYSRLLGRASSEGISNKA